MSPIQAAVWAFLKERFAGKETAAPRVTVLLVSICFARSPIRIGTFAIRSRTW